MRKSSKGSKGSPKSEQAPGGDNEVKVKAVNEMMERIKHGVVLRPVKGQDAKRVTVKQPPTTEEKPQESAMEELKGILETVKKSPSRGSQEPLPLPTGKKDSELEVILRRRRKQACDPGSGDDRDGQMSKVASSDSLNGGNSSSDMGKEPERPGPHPDPSREPAGQRHSPDPGRGPAVARRSSDSGREPRGDRGARGDRGSRASLSEKEASEPPITNGCIVSGEQNGKQKDEKCVRSNGISKASLSGDTHATLSPSCPAVPNPLNGNADAEC